jgi:molecular chaperone HtpG
VDAPVQFNALLFIPEQSWDWITPVWERPGLDLYVRRVLIQKGNKDLLPEYLGFLRGVIDSEDLPLNINRETIQENRLVQKVASTLVKQVLGHLVKMAADSPDKYDTFWRAHGKMFKMGYADFANHDKFGQLLRFNSSHFDDAQGLTSLDAYIERAKESQKEIYYVFGPSREAVRLNPHTEMFRTKGVEVLYLYEPVDEFAVDTLRTYKEWPLKSVEHVEPSVLEGFENVEDIEEAEPLPEEDAKEFDNFLDRFRDVLGEKVTAVRRSSRLKDSPVCLVNPDGGMSSSMQKIMKIVNKDESIPEKIIEVNQDHPTIRNLFRIYQNHPQDEYLTLAMRQLYESSLLLEGYLQDPHTLVGRIQKLLNRSSGWYLEVNDR